MQSQRIDTFFSPPRRGRGRPKKQKKGSGSKRPGRPPSAKLDSTPVQTVLSPGGTTRNVKNQGARTGRRESYASHTPNGKKMIQIHHRWTEEKDDWQSISKFAKAMVSDDALSRLIACLIRPQASDDALSQLIAHPIRPRPPGQW